MHARRCVFQIKVPKQESKLGPLQYLEEVALASKALSKQGALGFLLVAWHMHCYEGPPNFM